MRSAVLAKEALLTSERTVIAAAVIALASVSFGCGKERSGPEPSIATPEAVGDLPVEPGLICRDQLETELLLHGEGLSPMPIDVPGGARAALPDINFVLMSGVIGDETEFGFEILYSGEQGGSNAELVTWHDQSSMSLLVNQSLTLADGSEGVFEPGIYDARIVNPNTSEASSHGALAVVPRPTIEELAPGIVCLAEGSREVLFTGSTFLRHAVATPTLSGSGATFEEVLLDDCATVAHAGVDAEICGLATFVLGQDALAPGWHELVLENPETAGCHTEEVVQLRVVPQPEIDRVEPAAVCSADGSRAVVVHGADFLEIDGVLPEVTMDGEAIEVTGMGGCDDALPTTGHTVRPCSQLFVTIPVVDPADPLLPELIVTNPAPAGCSGSSSTELLLLPKPEIERVVPSLVCVAQGEREVRVEGTGFVGVGDELPFISFDGVEAQVLGLEGCVDLTVGNLSLRRCLAAVAVIPEASIDEGLALVFLENPPPVGCVTEHDTALRVVPPPEIISAEPALVCNAQGDSEVIISGTGFIGVGEGDERVLPEVTVDGTLAQVVALDGCEELATMDLFVETCSVARIVIPSETVVAGNPELVLTNPAPAGCSDANSDAITFVPPPTVVSVEPAVECLASGDRPIIIHGSGFLDVDGELPSLEVGGVLFAVTGIEGCETLVVEGMEVQSCERITATIQQDALLPGPALVLVENPEPAACSGSNDDAFFVVPEPSITDVQPPAVCSVDGTAVLVVTGESFVTVGDAGPIVALNGQIVDQADVTAEDCDLIDAVGTTIGLCRTVSVSFAADSFAGGDEITVSLTNPTPGACMDVHADTLPVIDPPVITASLPALVCTEDGSRTFVLEGSNFFSIDGVLPSVSFGGVEGVVDSLGGACEPRDFGALSATGCTEAVVTAPAGGLEPGLVEVTLTNPAPLSCGGSASDVLMAPPALVLTAAEPRSLCEGSGPTEIEITGDGFLIIDGVSPELRLDGVAVAIESIDGCADLPVPDGSSVQSCTILRVILDPQGRDGPVTVTVINPDSNETVPGCRVESDEILGVSPPPTILTVAPSAFCEGGAISLTLGGEGFTAFTTVLLSGEPGQYPAESTTLVSENELLASWADGAVPPGSYDVTVSNGPGCESTLPAAVDMMPTPLVFFVDPEVVYSGMSIQATVYVSGLTAEASQVSLTGPSGQIEILTGSAVDNDPNKIIVEIPEGLEAGYWDVEIVSQEECIGTLTDGLQVTDILTVAVESIDPSYVSPSESTAVTIEASETLEVDEVDFLDTPRLYLNPSTAGAGTVASPLRAVVFVDAKTLTAVIPGGLNPGVYDLIVVNPDGTAGALMEAVTVTDGEPPVISVIVPGTLTNEAGDHFAELRGAGFDAVGGVSVSMVCKRPDGTFTDELEAVVQAGTLTESSVTANFPATGIAEHSVCVVKLTNSDGAFFRYSAISIKNPSYNLSTWAATSEMNEGRRALSLVAGRPTPASRFLYAVGGDGGAGTALKDSVEQVSVGLFGDLGTWRYGRNWLPEGRAFAGVARIGRFVYLTGGRVADEPVPSVLRAEVLDPLAGPAIIDLDLALSEEPGGLAGGLWYYRVSPVFPAGHPTNPGGEGLPGEILPVRLPAVEDGVVLEIRWQIIDGASGYRVYRTPAPGSAAGELQLLAAIDGGLSDRLTDDGLNTDPDADPPLRSGELGTWHQPQAGGAPFALNTAREGHATVAVRHPDASSTYFLYAFGGEGAGGNLSTYEYATVTVAADGTHILGEWVEGLESLSIARRGLGAWAVTSEDTAAVPDGEVWIYVGPGTGAGQAGTRVEAARIDMLVNPGELEAFVNTSSTIGGGSSGYGYGTSGGWLFAFGGQGGAPSSGAIKAEVCSTSIGCLGLWSNVGIAMTEERVLMGSAEESAFFFMGGGWNGTEATSTVDRTVK